MMLTQSFVANAITTYSQMNFYVHVAGQNTEHQRDGEIEIKPKCSVR